MAICSTKSRTLVHDTLQQLEMNAERVHVRFAGHECEVIELPKGFVVAAETPSKAVRATSGHTIQQTVDHPLDVAGSPRLNPTLIFAPYMRLNDAGYQLIFQGNVRDRTR